MIKNNYLIVYRYNQTALIHIVSNNNNLNSLIVYRKNKTALVHMVKINISLVGCRTFYFNRISSVYGSPKGWSNIALQNRVCNIEVANFDKKK